MFDASRIESDFSSELCDFKINPPGQHQDSLIQKVRGLKPSLIETQQLLCTEKNAALGMAEIKQIHL